jgi:hypothetical protein
MTKHFNNSYNILFENKILFKVSKLLFLIVLNKSLTGDFRYDNMFKYEFDISKGLIQFS